MCFLCGSACVGPTDTRRVLSGEEFDRRLRSVIAERQYDEWAVAVQGHMDSASDLFAADAVYHLLCYTRFVQKLPHTPRKRRAGRPQKDEAMTAFCLCCTNSQVFCICCSHVTSHIAFWRCSSHRWYISTNRHSNFSSVY